VRVGAVSSIIRVGEVAPVFVFQAGSVTVTILLDPSNNPQLAVQLQSTVPLAVTGSGLQVSHGTVTLVPGSTVERLSVTVVPVCAGFGERLSTVGVDGSVLSTVILKGVPTVGFPYWSAIVGVIPVVVPDDKLASGVHVTVHAAHTGVGVHVHHEIVTVLHDPALKITSGVTSFVRYGSVVSPSTEVIVGADGEVSSSVSVTV
jgi:hypothetical protein